MTPATRLLEAARDWAHNVKHDDDRRHDEALLSAVREMMDVRALYPATHAIGERVAVRDWLNLRAADGPSELDFTGEVVGVQFIDGKVLYVVDAGAGLFASGQQVVDSAFVHPAEGPSPDRDFTVTSCTFGPVDAIPPYTPVEPPRPEQSPGSTRTIYRPPDVDTGAFFADPPRDPPPPTLIEKALAMGLTRDGDLWRTVTAWLTDAQVEVRWTEHLIARQQAQQREWSALRDIVEDGAELGFPPGTLVTLRSGGPVMTVDAVEGETVCVVWFVDGKLEAEEFCAAALVRA